MGKTKIIAIEGIDGSGKTVQFNSLCDALKVRGYTVDMREYPVYSSYFGGEVGRYLSGKGVRADEVDARSMALWFAMDRWDDLKDYRDGESDYMVINRYVLSNAAYQSVRSGDDGMAEWVFLLEHERLGIPKADVYLFYDVAPQAAKDNVLKKGFREYVEGEKQDVYESSEFIQLRTRDRYLQLAREREDVILIQCMGKNGLRTIADIAQETILRLSERGML